MQNVLHRRTRELLERAADCLLLCCTDKAALDEAGFLLNLSDKWNEPGGGRVRIVGRPGTPAPSAQRPLTPDEIDVLGEICLRRLTVDHVFHQLLLLTKGMQVCPDHPFEASFTLRRNRARIHPFSGHSSSR